MMPAKQTSGYLKFAGKDSQIEKSNSRNVKKRMHALFTRVACAMIIASFLANSTPAAPRVIYAAAAEFHRDVSFIILSVDLAANVADLAKNLLSFLAPSAKKQVTQLNRIAIHPGSMTMPQGQPVYFSAVGYSANGIPEGSLKFNWTIQDIGRNLQPRMLANGVFQASSPGTFRVTAEARGISAETTIIVAENRVLMTLKRLKAEEALGILTNVNIFTALGRYRTENISSKKLRRVTLPSTNLREIEQLKNSPEEIISEEDAKGKKTGGGPSAHSAELTAPSGKQGARRMRRPSDEDGWDDTNWETADDPGNQTGNPPGTSPDSIAGNGNFQFSAPIVKLPGRGIDLNLSLVYNSRLWNKSGNRMSYDSDKGYPSPGWSVGFGKIVFMGPGGGCMIADGDGTRHSYAGSVSNFTSGSSTSTIHAGHTADGTFINYTCYYSSSPNGKSLSATVKLPNGTTTYYSNATANAEQAFPTRISDAQGNFIDINYRAGRGPEINTIVDTMGRVITFNYDSSNRLISVSVPKMDNAGTRTAVRLHYKQIGLSPGFASPLISDAADWNPYVIDSIYYPGTDTGYWFNDNDSYSSYGMIAKVIEQRGMGWSAGPDDQGTISPGTMSKKAVYDYPLSADTALTDAPTFGQMLESWTGMNTADAKTTYSINNNDFHHDGTSNSPARTVTVKQPNDLISKQYSYRTPGVWTDGLIFSDETIVMNGSVSTVVSSSLNSWQNGAYDSPRPAWTKATDEKGQTLKTTYDYGANFNQVISQKQYDYNGSTVLRETRTEYENNSLYTNAGTHIFSLVKATEIYDGVGNRASKTEYEYDNNAVVNGTANHNLKETPGVTMHNSTYDPYTSDRVNGGQCTSGQFNYSQCSFEGQTIQIHLPGGGYDDVICQYECYEYEQVSAYNPNTIFRGNVTKTTTYANAVNLTGAIAQTKQYDTTGNLVAESASCCELKTYLYDDPNTAAIDTQYAYPVQQTRGLSDPNSSLRNTSSAVYDFFTGLIKQTTDANGRTDITTYNLDTLRPIVSTSSTGAYSTSDYNDEMLKIVNQTYEYGGGLASKNVKYLNGIGKVQREDALGADGIFDTVETNYTKSGQIWKKSRPYRSGEAVLWTVVDYDALGRTSEVTDPDGSVSKVFYNESGAPPNSASNLPGNTMRSRDAWGRERWTRRDALERLVEVVEPDPDGDGAFSATGNLAANYTYDTLGQVTETNQGGQIRRFRYDSLGRMTLQKLAEQSATINDAGQYVGEGASGAGWSGAVTYDDRSNIVQKVDARGVKINYSYQISGSDDSLNRLQKVSTQVRPENNPQLPGVALPIQATPDVTYEYMTTGDQNRIKKIRTAGVLTEDFTYDGEARVKEYTQTVDSRTDYPWVTTYYYDTLGRVIGTWYPAQYGPSGGSRKLVQNTYDVASRLTTLKVDGQDAASGITYNASDQTTLIKIGTSGLNQITENYAFDSQTGLLANQQAVKNGSALLDLSYDYARNTSAGNTNVAWKTGALTKIVDNLDRNKDRRYEYDALGRLTKAIGGINQTWTQQYVYDRYGNRTSVNAFGMESLRPSKSQGRVGDTRQNSREQNTGEAKLFATNTPPMAAEPARNDDSYTKIGKGPSADSPDSTDELPVLDDEKTSDQNDNEAEIAKVTGSEVKTWTLNEPAESPITKKEKAKARLEPVVNQAKLTLPPSRPVFDFDGDNQADVSTWNRTNGTWMIRRSQSGQTTATQLNGSGNQIAPGDYDGDGKTDEAVWNSSTGVWTIKQSSTGNTITQPWGTSGDAVVPADYDGDGKTDVAVWRPSTGFWYVLKSSDGTVIAQQFGSSQLGDIPTLGDFDGDNKADIAVWRPSNGVWYILQSSNGQVIYPQWGTSGDVPVPADYDADNKTDLAVWRPSNGVWYVRKSSNGQVLQAQLGSESSRDVLVPADYDGDQQADMAVWTPATATWTIRQSTTGANTTQQFGASGQLAVPSAYVRRSSAPKNQNAEIQRDGHANLSYNAQTNRITTSGFQYDAAGNQIKALAEDGTTSLKFEYDAANRLQAVRKDDANGTLVQAFQFGSTNARLIDYNAGVGLNTFYVNAGGKTLAEFTEYASNVQTWVKSYVYLGDRQLSTITPNGSGGEFTEYHHPDRLGTRLITNQAAGTSYEQAHLPFGTALNNESTIIVNNKRFTSYDRSAATGLDYAQNRTYDSKQGRFTQVDPIGMSAASLSNPQSLNLYNYVGNDPINRTDPTGLFWGAIGRFFKALFRVIAFVALVAAVIVLAHFGVGLIAAGGILNILGGGAILYGASFLAAKVGATIYSGVKEFLNKCNAPGFAGLSRARQDELAQRGVSPEQWNNLKNKQRLGYFNITAAIVSAGLSLVGWLVDWAAGGIQQDRTFFIQGQGATNLLAQVRSSSLFSLDKFLGTSYRLNTLTRSTELTFSSDGRRLEVDIDSFNPNRGLGGFFLHSYEVVSHTLGKVFGGTKTNPYNVAYRSSWECK